MSDVDAVVSSSGAVNATGAAAGDGKRACATPRSPVNVTAGNAIMSMDMQVVFERPEPSKGYERQNVVSLSDDLDSYLELVEKSSAGKRKPRNRLIGEAEDKLVISVREASELMVWADQHAPALWKTFEELKVGEKIVTSLEITSARPVRLQILQTLSIIIHSIRADTLKAFVYPKDIPNRILRCQYDFSDDEILFYYMSIIRSLAGALEPANLHFFVDEKASAKSPFPLYTEVLQFFDHRDPIVRIAVRNITLSLFLNGGPDVLAYAVHGVESPEHYFRKLTKRVSQISDAIVKVFVESNAKEPTKAKLAALGDVLLELHNMLDYFNEALSISPLVLGPVLGGILMEIYRPLILKLTSQVRAVRSKGRSAPANFSSLLLVLSMTLLVVDNKILSSAIASEMGTYIESLRYSPLYGIKAVACTTRDERAVNMALCAMESITASKYVSIDNLVAARYVVSEEGLRRALSLEKLQSDMYALSESGSESMADLDADEIVAEEMVSSQPHSQSQDRPTSLYDNAKLVQTKNTSSPSSVTSQLARLELGNELQIANDMEDVFLLLFLRPSPTRSARVLQSGARLMFSIAKKTENFYGCAVFVRRVLDEILEGMARYLEANEDHMNAGAIEVLYDMFSIAIRNRSGLTESPQSLERALMDPSASVPQSRHEDLKRRKLWSAPPDTCTRQSDVDAFFVLFWLYSTLCGCISIASDGEPVDTARIQEQVQTLFNSVRVLFDKQGPQAGSMERKTKIVLGVLAMVIDHDLNSIRPQQSARGLDRTKSAIACGTVYQQLTTRIQQNRDAMVSVGDMTEEDDDIEQALSALPSPQK